MTEQERLALKESLKNSVGKIKHKIKRAVDPLSKKLKDGRAKIDVKYEKGVTKTQTNPIIDKMADLTSGLTEKNEKELLENKDSTFRKIRKCVVNGTVILTPFIIGLPIKMIDDAIQNNVDLDNAEKYDDIYEREIMWTEAEIKKLKAEGKDTEKLQKYLNNLKTSRAKMKAHIEKLKEAEEKNKKEEKAAKESMRMITDRNSLNPLAKFTLMRREHYNSDDEYDTALITTFEQLMYGAAQSIDYYKKFNLDKKEKRTVKETYVIDTDKRKSAFIIANGIIMESVSKDKTLMNSFEDHIGYGHQINFNNGSSDKVQLAGFDYSRINKPINEKLNYLMESINNKIKYTDCKISITGKEKYPILVLEGITQKAEDITRKVVHTVRNALPEENPVKSAERASEPLDDAVNKIISGVKDALTHDKREEIAKGQYRFKLIRIIGKCIVLAGAWYIHPALAAIVFLGKMAFDKHIDHKERSKIVNDLESELEICKEKIKDAESKGDNENKYKLMRIRKALETETTRIKLHLDK